MKKATKRYILFMLMVITNVAYGQDATTTFGYGYNFIKNEPTIDFQFNRKSATKAEDKYELKVLSGPFFLSPSSEVHLGDGTENSENNILLTVNSYIKDLLYGGDDKMWTGLYRINILAPQLAADKEFEVYQGYLTIGGDLIYYYSRRDLLGYIEGSLGADYNQGISEVDSTDVTENVNRIKIRPSFQWQFWGKRSDLALPPELDENFYYKADLNVRYIHYRYFQQDERIINDKSIGYFNIALGYRFVKNIKLIVEYKTGRMEPKFNKVNSLSFGLALVN